MTDPFAPIGRAPHLKVVDGGEWDLVAPVPEDAVAVPKAHATLGAPAARFEYRDEAARLLGYVDRYNRPDGKEFRPWALWRSRKDGSVPWRNQLWPTPRPLYGLDELAAHPAAPVVVVEGEKAADAARRLLPDHVVVTSPGGSNAAAKANWKPLAGRHVIVWPDADPAGAEMRQRSRKGV